MWLNAVSPNCPLSSPRSWGRSCWRWWSSPSPTSTIREPPPVGLAPVFIDLTVSALISVVSPLTQACFNPARDFGPRLFAFLAGWVRSHCRVHGAPHDRRDLGTRASLPGGPLTVIIAASSEILLDPDTP